ESTGAFTGSTGGAYWRPLFLLWMLVNRTLFGLEPWGWHLTTVVVHSLAALLMYFVALRILRDRFLAGFAATLFGVYPVTIESAAWIAGVTDPLMAVFLLPAFLVYLKSWEAQSRHWRALSLVFYVLALMVKETAVILPVLVLAHAWLYRGDVPANLLGSRGRGYSVMRSFLPYAAFTAIYLAERSLVLSTGEPPAGTIGIKAMILTWPALVSFYLRLLLVPNSISPHYNLRALTEFQAAPVLVPLFFLIVLAVMIVWVLRRVSAETRRQVVFALVWIVTPMLPVLYISRMAPGDFAHIRYLYFSVIGLAMLLAVIVGKLPVSRNRIFGVPASQALAAGVLVLASAIATARSQQHWENNFTLFAHAVEVAPRNARALTNYAIELGEKKRFDEAIQRFHEALSVEPDLWYANVDLGFTYYLIGRYEEGIRYMQRGTELNPNDPQQFTYLAAAQIKAGRLDLAEEAIRKAIALAPGMPSYHLSLGLILERQGKLEDARNAFLTELEIDPANEMARAKLEQMGQRN
ncbi:MAG: tetratricopeptide repeat protein, partial [Candidatus Korobacteraceae bacterium]